MQTRKKVTAIFAATVLAASAATLSACGTTFTPPKGDYTSSSPAVSNGGFVVEYGSYVYFINGVETADSNNTYGTPVKGSLMRISRENLDKKINAAETVIPSLMVAGDYTSGLYIYKDRVYFATPNNVRNTSGVIETNYLDFKSAKLDGTDIKSYFNVDGSDTVYRYVSVEDTVYLMYEDDSDIHSYNTATGDDTLLVKGTQSHVFHLTEKGNPYVYYTMSVTGGADTANPSTYRYQQIYRVRADAKEGDGYEYTWDQEYLDEHNDGEVPYVNLGEIVLDGIGSTSIETQFTHDLKDGVTALTTNGYTYSLESYQNGGIYFTRKELVSTDSEGESGWLYYLPESSLGSNWNSVSGNAVKVSADSGYLDVVAQGTANASTTAAFYVEESGEYKHHYLYVSDSEIKRADVKQYADGAADEMRIALNVSGATLMPVGSESAGDYKYLYFYRTSGSGVSVERAVYNGTADDYNPLNFGEKEEYKPVKVLDVQHVSSWYPFEIVNGTLFFADAQTFSSTTYDYVSAVSLTKGGTYLTNSELRAFNEKWDEVKDYITEVASDQSDYSHLLECYFYAETDKYFNENLQEAKDAGKKDTYLLSQEEQDAFAAYVAGTSDEAKKFTDEDGNSYRKYSYYVTKLGKVTSEAEESWDSHWKSSIPKYTPPTTEEEGLAWWAWTLIGVGIGVGVAGIALAIILPLYFKKKKKTGTVKREKMVVDTTDDRSLDVYATGEANGTNKEPVSNEPTEETPAEEGVEASAETNEEVAEAESETDEAPAAEPVDAPSESAESAPNAEGDTSENGEN